MVAEVGGVAAGAVWGWWLRQRAVGPPLAAVAVAVLALEALALAGSWPAACVCAGSAAGGLVRALALRRLARWRAADGVT